MWGVLAASLFFLPFNRLLAWLILAASAAMGLYHGVLTPLSLGYLLVIAAVAWLRYHFHAIRHLAITVETMLVASCLALFLHLVPGIHNPLMINGEKTGPLSPPFTLYYHFDKALVPFLLFACLPTLFSADSGQRVGKAGWIALLISMAALLLLAVTLGRLKIELHTPSWLLQYAMANLFFTCMAEEALFRGYLQQRLSQWLSAWPALIITALIFGTAHLAGGMWMVMFATLAGLIFGLDVEWSAVGADPVPFRA
ncbi:CAAX protease self-immunity family protein [Serratia symbiotica SCt-VLC]|uniref:CAAX protease self-immunity family protein n=1 Tax=Serratia symbiotica SCt-VLC TaxID=1347341 RepID=A0A068R9P7_9GAMM|nr:CAAX protease self-immunity family protein [Serratia symbiotica SCt-VLC]